MDPVLSPNLSNRVGSRNNVQASFGLVAQNVRDLINYRD
jgi:hypothetical protein